MGNVVQVSAINFTGSDSPEVLVLLAQPQSVVFFQVTILIAPAAQLSFIEVIVPVRSHVLEGAVATIL